PARENRLRPVTDPGAVDGRLSELVPGADPHLGRSPRRAGQRRQQDGPAGRRRCKRSPLHFCRRWYRDPRQAGNRFFSGIGSGQAAPCCRWGGGAIMPIVAFPGLAPAVPEVVLVCPALALLIIGGLRGEGSSKLVSWLSVAGLIATLVIARLFE